MSYCTYVATIRTKDPNNVHVLYHDHHYGFAITDDQQLFERLVLEINQAGLSWETILKKQENFSIAYDQFDIQKVAQYQEQDIARLLADAGIIRNKLKINAAIYNANQILQIQASHGSFHQWLLAHHPLSKTEWVKLFKKHFKFVGGEIVGEFLMSIGLLPGAHDHDCATWHQIQAGI